MYMKYNYAQSDFVSVCFWFESAYVCVFFYVNIARGIYFDVFKTEVNG